MNTPWLLDFETQSEISIVSCTYTYHPSTDIICMAYGPLGGEPLLWCPGDELAHDFIEHVKAGGMLGASNAPFDEGIWENIAVPDYDFPATEPEQWFCTQAQARVNGLPSALDKTARAMGLQHRKDSRGTRLINACCIPPYSTDPQDYLDLMQYCLQDFRVMDAACIKLPFLTETELEDYHNNERINRRGIRIDLELAQAAQNYAEVEREELAVKLAEITCGAVEKTTQHARFTKWLRDCLEDDECEDALKLMKVYKNGEQKWSSDKTVRANLLAGDGEAFHLAPDIVEALEVKDDAGGSAVAKFGKLLNMADPKDQRVRGVLRFAGAPSTQRFSSLGAQLHNFRRDTCSVEETEHYKRLMMQGEDLVDLEGKPVRVMETLAKLLRPAIIPGDGKVFVVGDWSSVEARMTSYLADDQHKLDVFRRGEDPYCYAATGIYGRKITPEDKEERQVGKVVELAAGFLGGVGALKSMATMFGLYLAEEKMQGIIDAYRASHPKVVGFGRALMDAALGAMLNPGHEQKAREITYYFVPEDGVLYCELPDGLTTLAYPQARIDMKPAPWDDEKLVPDLTALKAAIVPAADAKEWTRHGIWSGTLLENCCQASCCIMLKECVHVLEHSTPYDVAFHVHDEIILEVDEDEAEDAKQVLQEVMEESPEWAPGIPLTAEPEILKRYGKA